MNPHSSVINPQSSVISPHRSEISATSSNRLDLTRTANLTELRSPAMQAAVREWFKSIEQGAGKCSIITLTAIDFDHPSWVHQWQVLMLPVPKFSGKWTLTVFFSRVQSFKSSNPLKHSPTLPAVLFPFSNRDSIFIV